MSSSSGINKAGLLSGNFWQRTMKESDMQAVIGAFVDAAHIARRAKLMPLKHGPRLPAEPVYFPLSNKRRDQYAAVLKTCTSPARVLAVKEAVAKT